MTEPVRFDLAIHSLCRGKMFGVGDITYESIVWHEPNEPKPSREALEAEWEAIKADVAAQTRVMGRRMAYPSIDELVVALWEKLVETDGLTSDAITTLQAKRQQVKNDIP